MAIEVAKIELKTVQDASGLEACIAKGQFTADEVIAVIGKTEGNGGVNDFTRILADQAFRRVLLKHGKRSEAEIARIPMVWSGGCDGVITPHATVFARNGKTGPSSQAAPGDRHRDERGAFARGHRPAGDGREGRRRRQSRDARRRHRRSQGRALRADQDAAADDRFGARRGIARPARRLRGARFDGRLQRHDRARHRRGARRDQDAARRADLQRPRSLFLGGVLLVGRGAHPGADRAARQQGRRRRTLPHRPRGHARRARHRRHLRRDPQCRARAARAPARRRPQGPRGELLHEVARPTAAARCAGAARSCSTIPTCTTTGIRRPRSAASRPPRSAIPRCSCRSTPCTRARKAAGR